jgi:hypothetical protein
LEQDLDLVNATCSVPFQLLWAGSTGAHKTNRRPFFAWISFEYPRIHNLTHYCDWPKISRANEAQTTSNLPSLVCHDMDLQLILMGRFGFLAQQYDTPMPLFFHFHLERARSHGLRRGLEQHIYRIHAPTLQPAKVYTLPIHPQHGSCG